MDLVSNTFVDNLVGYNNFLISGSPMPSGEL